MSSFLIIFINFFKALAYVQAGLLYTNDASERRIRVITAAIPITSTIDNLYKNVREKKKEKKEKEEK